MLKWVSVGFERFSGVYLWVVFVVVFGIWTPHLFLSLSTVHLVASTQAVAGIVSLAVLVPIVCGQFDLSVGSNAGLTGLVAVVVQNKYGWSLGPTIVVSLAVGLLVGVVNGFVVVRFKVNSFIATLGMGSILSALALIVTNSSEQPPPTSSVWNDMTQYQIFGFQAIIYYLLAFALVTWWVLELTPVGRRMYATGANIEAARLSGIGVQRLTWWSLIVSGGIAGAGGVLYTSYTGPSSTFGSTLLLPAFAAVFLGSTQLHPGRFNVWGTLIAIFVLATGVEGLELVSGAGWVADMFNGVALILAVALAVSRQGKATHSRRSWRSRAGSEVPEAVEVASRTPTRDSETELTDL
jgi:ribose transport system permease protein